MPLAPLPTDPEPAQSEIQRIVHERKLGGERGRMLAPLIWKVERAREDPDAFLVAFSEWITDWSPWTSYRYYLESALWKRIRREVLSEAHHRCAGCRGIASEVHHRDYRPRVLRGEDRSALVALCRDCHRDKIHRTRDGKVRDVWQDIEQALKSLVEDKEEIPT